MIGIFDSGLGGLTVLKEIRKVLPTNDLMYFGDTAHVPYGNRSDEVIFQLTQKAVEFLFSQGAEYVVVACNTASARALPKLLDNTQTTLPGWLDRKATVGKVLRLPERDEMEQAIDEQLIVEYYSR